LRSGPAFFVTRADGAIWLRRRPPHGLLGGMLEVPSAPWRDGGWDDARGPEAAPPGLDFTMLPGVVRHGFTHFALELKVFAASATREKGRLAGEWCPLDKLGEAALPSLMRKVVAHGLKVTAQREATTAPPAASGAARRSARAARRE
jgi:A/G-specific adenine glycosylase